MAKKLSRRAFLRGMGATGAGLAAMMAGCQPKTVVVEKQVTVEVEKEKVVKETVVVEKQVGPVELETQTLRFGAAQIPRATSRRHATMPRSVPDRR